MIDNTLAILERRLNRFEFHIFDLREITAPQYIKIIYVMTPNTPKRPGAIKSSKFILKPLIKHVIKSIKGRSNA